MASLTSHEGRQRTAVITGAGSGIGLAVARRLLADGLRVVAIGRRPDPLKALAAEAPDAVTALPLDVADADAVERAFDGIDRIDALVINHGICHTASHDAPDGIAVWRSVLSTNLDGAYHVLRAASPRVPDGGRVVTVASGLGKLGRAGKSAYAASKHGLLGLTRCVAAELAPRRITVNAVCPGWVDTDMARADVEREAGPADPSTVRAAAEAAIPLGRFVRPDEVAALVAWLCGPDAAMITGQAYNISGGELGV